MSDVHLFSSESVTEGHPDKLADQISDAVLDAMLAEDPNCRVACETLVTTGLVMVAGEITLAEGWVDIPSVVRNQIVEVGYTDAKFGLDGDTCGVITAIQEQSPDIARGVNEALEHREDHSADDLDTLGAGDQGMMFGFACRETEELMPTPIAMAHRLAKRLADVRRAGVVPYLRPDGKSQVSIEYRDGKPVRVDTVLISAQHREEVDVDTLLKPDIVAEVIDPVLREFPELRADDARDPREPHGAVRDRRSQGRHRAHRSQDHRRHVRRVRAARRRRVQRQGPDQGRPVRRVHGALRREDRRGGRPRRHVPAPGGVRDRHRAPGVADARHVRHRDLSIPRSSARRCGTSSTSARPPSSPRLDLRRPIYRETAAYGHFGRKEFPWEATDRADDLRSAVG